jgi:DNA-directed RNA polymerase subunit RPC12/RpoP
MTEHEREPEQEYFDPEGPGEHDQHLFDSDTEANDYVNCPNCRERILAFAERCPECGHWFTEGEAWQEADEAGFPRSFVYAAGAVVVALLLWLFLP